MLSIYKGLIRPYWVLLACVGNLLQLIYLTVRSQKHSVISTHLASPHNCPLWSCAVMLLLSLSLFSRYYIFRCSEELNYCVPGPRSCGRNTMLAASSQEFCVEVCNQRIDRYGFCLFPYTGNLCNSLPPTAFPPCYICLLANVGCTGTSEPLIEFFTIFHNFLKFFISICILNAFLSI